jgi:hypothetical protein
MRLWKAALVLGVMVPFVGNALACDKDKSAKTQQVKPKTAQAAQPATQPAKPDQRPAKPGG